MWDQSNLNVKFDHVVVFLRNAFHFFISYIGVSFNLGELKQWVDCLSICLFPIFSERKRIKLKSEWRILFGLG